MAITDYSKGVVTTPRNRNDLDAVGKETALRVGVPFVPRREKSLAKIMRDTGAIAVYVESPDVPFIQTSKGPVFFHQATSGMKTDNPDIVPGIIRAMDLKPDDRILDTTLGLGTDAIVAATGLDSGTLTGLEQSPLLSDLVSRELCRYEYTSTLLEEAARRITVVNAGYQEFLEGCADNEYDVIYFDPMFENTVIRSVVMQRMREIACMDPLDRSALDQAMRVASKRVIIKTRRGYYENINYYDVVSCGKSIVYGILLANK